jgi:hypothetical protein
MGTRVVTASLALRSLVLSLALVLFGPLAPSVSQADDAREAQVHFERAIQLYQARAYEEALAEFQRAYQLAPRYQVLFNIAQVHYQLNEYAEALRAFEGYLRRGGHALSGERRAFVQRELAELRERVGTLTVVTDVPGASVLVDDLDVGVTPLEPLSVDIGRHVVRVELSGHPPITRKVHITSGAASQLSLVLAPPEAQAWPGEAESVARDAVSAHPRRRAALWALGSSTLALGAGAGASFALAYRGNRQLDEQLTTLPPDGQAVDDLRQRVRRAALASDVLGATALAAAAGLVVTLIATRAQPEDGQGARVRSRGLSARLEAGPGSLWLRGSF